MKSHAILVLAFAVSAVGVLQISIGAPVPKDAPELDVQVVGEKLFINHKAVPMPGERETVIELLGEPSHVLDKINTLLVWDKLGIVVYENPNTNKITQVNVALGEIDLPHWPKNRFRGKLTLDGISITADTTIEAINREIKGKKFGPSELRVGSWIDYETMYVLIFKAKDRHINDNGTIAEFIIGRKSK